MRLRNTLVFAVVVGCQNPAGSDTAGLSGSPNTGDPFSGSTGQSGTMPLSCVERDPGTSSYAYDDPTPVGFTAREALAPILSTAGTLSWEADGSSTGLTGTISVDEAGLNIQHDANALIVCVDLHLLTDDGRMDATLIADGLRITAVGEADLLHEDWAGNLPIDPAMLGDTGQERLRFDLTLSLGTTSGILDWAPAGSSAWSLAATW